MLGGSVTTTQVENSLYAVYDNYCQVQSSAYIDNFKMQILAQPSTFITCDETTTYDAANHACTPICADGQTYEVATKRCRGGTAFDLYDLYDAIATSNTVASGRAANALGGSFANALNCWDVTNVPTLYS